MRFYINLLLIILTCTSFSFASERMPVNNQVFEDVKSTTAVNWHQHSIERNAIYHEIFFFAEKSIKEKVANSHLKSHTWGIIVDIDETLLDNFISFQGRKSDCNQIEEIISFTTPGAKNFIESIHKLGGIINLVTNRPITSQKEIISKLKSNHIFFDQILFSNSNLDKNPRFLSIIQGKPPSQLSSQRIVAWLGDNIEDFPNFHQTALQKIDKNNLRYDEFGSEYFIFPNPIYGSWKK